MTLSNNRFITASLSKLETETYNPISGFETQPLVSLEEAVQPIAGLVLDVLTHVKTAMEKCIKNTPLSVNESAAIYLYTMPESFYGKLNETLRNENRSDLVLWFPYLKLFLNAVKKLPPCEAMIWRGVCGVVASGFQQNNIHTWWSITSCSRYFQLAHQFTCDRGTLFSIKSLYGRDISMYSAETAEGELILLPGTHLLVKDTTSDPVGISTVHLEEW